MGAKDQLEEHMIKDPRCGALAAHEHYVPC